MGAWQGCHGHEKTDMKPAIARTENKANCMPQIVKVQIWHSKAYLNTSKSIIQNSVTESAGFSNLSFFDVGNVIFWTSQLS